MVVLGLLLVAFRLAGRRDGRRRGRAGPRSAAPRPCASRATLGVVACLSRLAHLSEDRERAIEMLTLMRGHDACPDERTAALDRGVERDVGVDAGVVERLPEQDGLPV